MIIKSLSRKKQSGRSIRASINDLYSYIIKGSDASVPYICHNLSMGSNGLNDIEIINQFEKLITKLPKHNSRNLFYHEIISFKRNEYISLPEQLDILRKTVILYLQERGKDNLAFGAVHSDHAKDHIHYHILLTANTFLEPNKRFALSKKEFSTIQKLIEKRVQEMAPKLNLESVYNKEHSKNSDYYKFNSKEYCVKQRLGEKKTNRESIKELLLNGFELSYDSKSFMDFLSKFKIRFYQRGKNTGIIFQDKKYRLNRLGLESKHQAFYESVIKFEQNLNQIEGNNISTSEIWFLSFKEKEKFEDLLNFIKNNTSENYEFEFD